MHRTRNVLRLATWCVLLGLAFFGTNTGRANAQQPSQKTVVPIGGTVTIKTKPGRKVMKVNVVLPGVVKVGVAPDAQSVLVTGLRKGSTGMTITNDLGMDSNYVIVVPDPKELDLKKRVEHLRKIISVTAPTASVEVQLIGGDIVLTGAVSNAEDSKKINEIAQGVAGKQAGVLNSVRIGGVMQVQLDVVIAQVSRNEIRNMSFSFFVPGRDYFFGSALSGNNVANSALGLGTAAATTTLTGSSNLLFGFIRDQTGFFGFLQALRTEGLAKFLAEPRLVTLSGRPASFQSGGRLAIPEPSGLGTNAIRFENFGTELHFLPVVSGKKIYLEVEPVVNNINAANGTTIQGTIVPGFDTQRLHTSVELQDGQTFVLGGLIQNQINATAIKVPILGDLPFLGAAFSTKSYNQTESELLIIITPRLVDAATCEQLPRLLPGQETRTPDDFELFLEGILEAPRGQRCVFPDGRYRAAYRNGPLASLYPCGSYGGCASGSCNTDCCGSAGCGAGGCTTGTCTKGAVVGQPAGDAKQPAKTKQTSHIESTQEFPLPTVPEGTRSLPLPGSTGVTLDPMPGANPSNLAIPRAGTGR